MHGSSRRRDAGAERDVWNSEPDHKSEPLDDGVRKICTVWKLCVASFQSRARAVRAQFRAFSPSFPFFPRWRPGLCFSGSGILCCVLGERERVWKGKKRGFLLFFFLVWFWVSFCGVRMGRSRSYSPPVRRERSRSPAPPRRGRHIDDGWSRGDGRDSRKHGRDRNSGGRHRSPPTSLLVRNISRDSRLSCYLFSNCLVCIRTVHFSG